MKNLLEIDNTKPSHKDLEYLSQLLYNRFHERECGMLESEQILNVLERLGLDIEDNLMRSDYEGEFNQKYERINKN